MSLNLDDIQLPADVGAKPAEFSDVQANPQPIAPVAAQATTIDPATGAAVEPAKPTTTPVLSVTPNAQAPAPVGAPSAPDPLLEKVPDPTKTAETPATPPTQTPPAQPVTQQAPSAEVPTETTAKEEPFHKNPDWIKMQEQVKVAQEQTQLALAEIERLSKISNQAVRTPSEIADEEYQKKVAAGWEPESRVEEMRVYQELFDKAKTNVTQQLQDKQQAEIRAFGLQVNLALSALGISKEDGDLVKKEAARLENEGLINSSASPMQVMGYVYESMKAQGKIGDATPEAAPPTQAPATPSVATATPSTPAPVPNATAAAGVNSLINQPGQGSSLGQAPTTNKPNYKQIHGQDMDSLIMNLSKGLG